MVQKVAGSFPVSHPIDYNSLRGNELRHVPDGEYLSGIFYVATPLGLRALFPSEKSRIFENRISVGEERN